jgi:hypothetical protein
MRTSYVVIERGDQRAALHQQARRGVSPPQGVRQARGQLAHQTRPRPAPPSRARRFSPGHTARGRLAQQAC